MPRECAKNALPDRDSTCMPVLACRFRSHLLQYLLPLKVGIELCANPSSSKDCLWAENASRSASPLGERSAQFVAITHPFRCTIADRLEAFKWPFASEIRLIIVRSAS
jgi:hypothetical protein